MQELAQANNQGRRVQTLEKALWEQVEGDEHPGDAPTWSTRYGSKMEALRCWGGRYFTDHHYGHKGGVRCCKLLPGYNLLATGSLDKTVRLWSLDGHSGGMLSVSRPHGGIVRSLALDARALVSGSSDSLVRVWAPSAAGVSSDRHQPLFDVSSAPSLVLCEHKGPVAAMCMTQDLLFTGSWDYTVRVWERSKWESGASSRVWMYDDWVGCVAARGPHLLVAAGPEVYVHDVATGAVVRKFQGLHEGHVTCVEGSMNGRMLYTGAADGLVLAHDLRMRDPSCVLWHHNGAVHSLSYEDPWLASGAADGTVVLLNTEAQMQARQQAAAGPRAGGASGGASSSIGARALSSTCRALHAAHSGALYCVDMADQVIAAGSESSIVALFDFRGASSAAERAAAAKDARKAAREAKKARWQQQQHHQHHRRQQQQQLSAQAEAAGSAPAAPSTNGSHARPLPHSAHPHQQWRAAAGRAEGNGGMQTHAVASSAHGHSHGHGGRRKKVHTPHVPVPVTRGPPAGLSQQMVALSPSPASGSKGRSHGAGSSGHKHG
eukprot:CAMPEP_0202861150 /NCGR_PEP_ID=MMETSP1391-20130828/2639_1 /ASSEMBLY_ACC=CAM_ASM_000867 /TAXON_ID=1034604 /ORGANISM="Chlamydomonas leiostraca, Strain SAG 11-49" /LENGTH=547 /DNA_ID=CAMNT_0049540483 /DNA_START=115 /DNA_END=1759 /DNA_ORIENTATION=+